MKGDKSDLLLSELAVPHSTVQRSFGAGGPWAENQEFPRETVPTFRVMVRNEAC
jgi:hypothetical protein